MTKYFLRIAMAVLGFAALSIAAKGQSIDELKVSVPYEFVVNGKTLPAGTYVVNRVFGNDPWDLALTSLDHRAYAVVVSRTVEETLQDKPRLTFQEIDGQHFLAKIETAYHIFAIPVSKPAAGALMQTRRGSTGSTSAGASGAK